MIEDIDVHGLNEELRAAYEELTLNAANKVIGNLDLCDEIRSIAIGGIVAKLIASSQSQVDFSFNQQDRSYSIRYTVKGW